MNLFSQNRGKGYLTLPVKFLISVLIISSFCSLATSEKSKQQYSEDLSPIWEEDTEYSSNCTNPYAIGYLTLDSELIDIDNDGIPDKDERKYDTDPLLNDTDFDGLLDGEEVFIYNTVPSFPDTDFDGLTDGEEVLKYKTNPLISDTDRDGLCDGWEVFDYPTSPLIADTDFDNIKDGYEILVLKSNPLTKDSDYDLLEDYEEYKIYKTDINNWDTDGDSISDGFEIFVYKTNPLKSDTDGDSKADYWEIKFGRNPLVKDNWYNILSYVLIPTGSITFVIVGLIAVVDTKLAPILFRSRNETELENTLKQFADLLHFAPKDQQLNVHELASITGESVDVIKQLIMKIFNISDDGSGINIDDVVIKPSIFNNHLQYTCFYCGQSITFNAETCTICLEPVVRCVKCNDPISYEDSYVQCTKCGVFGRQDEVCGIVKTDLICEACYVSYKYQYL